MNKGTQAISKESLIENTPRNFGIGMAIIAICTFICYTHGFNNQFTWDGRQYILENNHLTPLNWKNIKTIFTSYELGNYHPFTILSYAIEALFVGQKTTWLYHLDQTLLHIANCYLIFRIILKLNGNLIVGFITALLFAIHPLHVESVIWDGERKDTLYCLFLLISFDYYIEYWKKGENWTLLAWSVFFFICSCLSKAMAVILPLVLLITDYYFLNRKISFRLIWEKAPYFIIAIIFGLIATKAQKDIGADASAAFAQLYSYGERFFFATFGLAFYWKKMLWPTNLSGFYPYPIKPFAASVYFTAFEVLIILGVLAYLSFKNRQIAWGTLYYGIVILPVLQLLPIGSAIVAERYFYVSSIGPLFIIALIINYLLSTNWLKKIPIPLVLTVLFAPLIFMSFQRVKVWKSDYYLFKNVIKQFPENGFITGNVGWYFEAQEHNKDSAAVYFKKAIALGWETSEMQTKLGEYAFDKKDYQTSVAYYKKGIAKNPKNGTVQWMLATAYYYLDSLALAENHVNTALKLDSLSFNAYNVKGLIETKQQKYDLAIKSFNKSIKTFTEFDDPYINLSHVYNVTGQKDKEIDILQKLIKKLPVHKELLGYKNLGAAYVGNGNYLKAIENWKAAIKLDTLQDNSFQYNIGLQYGLNDNTDQAIFWLKDAAKSGNLNAQAILKEKEIKW
jgi:protein O-mannosyl-transferase